MQLIIWFTEINNNIIYIDENIVKNYIYDNTKNILIIYYAKKHDIILNRDNSTEVEYRFNLKVGLNFVRRYRNELTGILLNYSFDPALYIDYSKIDLSNNIVENTRII